MTKANETMVVADTTPQPVTIFEEGKVKFFWMNTNYNNYLRGIDDRVRVSVKDGKGRPSVAVGVVLNGHNYIIPLTSQYSSKWKNQMTFKIKEQVEQENGSFTEEIISCLKINNMHPALESEIIYIDFETQTEDYKRLLYKEYDYIKKNLNEVLDKANKLHQKVISGKGKDIKVFKDNSCSFALLEDQYQKYDPNITYPNISMSY
ncbi:type III toxin-antitoxin system ToxN/AbiQ family toxin [Paenibacillus qinlingensis]|uniref:Protein AbiQ n=1 Tax=Paenibacillus qinlingensis TaxID=1837343 RepID=A0ABU1P3N1_9BACL|nr:type III toxin-antitoxin system ToxN/AbiQ family toxin [Paenibacillus qinlingensis]MDR6554164.1 protein AbiQ [Paenibacillus qinlingensis]